MRSSLLEVQNSSEKPSRRHYTSFTLTQVAKFAVEHGNQAAYITIAKNVLYEDQGKYT